MIIWSRWGIVVFVMFGVGVGMGFGLGAVFAPGQDSGPGLGVCMGFGFLLATGGLWLLDHHVLRRHLDRPQPVFVTQPLPQPWVDAQGRTTTHQRVPVVNQVTGEQVLTHPRSTFFFIPVPFWVRLIGLAGTALVLVNTIRLLL